jgi:hypothetical protein
MLCHFLLSVKLKILLRYLFISYYKTDEKGKEKKEKIPAHGPELLTK